MNTPFKEGMEIVLDTRVKEADTARVYGSGLLDVYSTPAMVAFMEKTSMELVQPHLEEGYGTVGMLVDIRHLKAVPPGARIRCSSTLAETDGNKLRFEVRVFNDSGIIGEGIHERYIINEKRFLSKIKI